MAETVMNFRVPEELKKGFDLIAESQDLTSSQLIRKLMRAEVENWMKANAQRELITQKKEPRQPKASTKQKKQPSASGIPLLDGLMKKGGV